MNNNMHAVLTGDIVKSSRLQKNELEKVRILFRNAVDTVNEWEEGLAPGELEFFRGDAWQLLLDNPKYALRAAVFLRASLIADGNKDTRISIGLGHVDNVPHNRVTLSTGEAFTLSGHGLDAMTSYTNLAIEIPRSIGNLSNWLHVVAYLCDSIICKWSKRQAEIVCVAADPKELKHDDIAQELFSRTKKRTTKQNITKILRAANWRPVWEAIRQFEKTEWNALYQRQLL